MAPRDPVTNLLMRAKQRHVNAERKVADIQSAMARELVAPTQGAKRDQLQNLLAKRIAERDEALRALQDLQRRPRSVLEKQLAAPNLKEGT